MGFRVPTFNLFCNVWRNTNDNANPPDLAGLACCLVNGRSGGSWFVGFAGATAPQVTVSLKLAKQTMSLLVPKLTDVRPAFLTAADWGDLVECPAGSGRYYWMPWMDDVGKGFANEHRECALVPWDNTYQAYVTGAWSLGVTGGWPAPVP